MLTIERMFLIYWRMYKPFVLLTPEDIQEGAREFAQKHNLNEIEVREHLTRVYHAWYDEALADCKGSTELLESLSRLGALRGLKGVAQWG